MGAAGTLFWLTLGQQVVLLGPEHQQMVLRLAEEAEIFAQSANKVIAEETLHQRALKPERWLRVGASALEKPVPRYQERELRSEFGYALIGDGDKALYHEARQVLSVDGKPVQSTEKAQRRLVSGLRSNDDEVKKRLLEDLEKHGLEGSATDFSLMLLLFRQRNRSTLDLRPVRAARMGADNALVFAFEQKTGPEAFTVFHGKQTLHQQLKGEVWLKYPGGLPLRIVFISEIPGKGGQSIMDRGQVDYIRSPNGTLMPVSVIHRRMDGNALVCENLFSYTGFKRFAADSEVKFTTGDEPAPPAKP